MTIVSALAIPTTLNTAFQNPVLARKGGAEVDLVAGHVEAFLAKARHGRRSGGAANDHQLDRFAGVGDVFAAADNAVELVERFVCPGFRGLSCRPRVTADPSGAYGVHACRAPFGPLAAVSVSVSVRMGVMVRRVDGVIAIEPPGRLPTVVREVGGWQREMETRLGRRVEIVSLNVAFWVRVLGDRGGEHAHRLCDPASYTSAGTYLEAIEPLAAVVDRYASGDGFVLALDRGPVVPGVDYHDTSVLVAYAQRDGELYTLVDEMVRDVALSAVPLVLLSVTSAYELLTALMTAVAIRRVRPSAHVCLVDHAWENFSLHRHIERFGDASPLLGVFDSVIAGRETQAADLRGLLDSLGFSAQTALAVTVRSVGRLPTAGVGGRSLAPPVVWTRVDDGTCYWGRCTFCVQNDKGGNERSAVSAAVTRARERVVELELRGVERVILADEALHPQVLSTVADGMADTSLVWCGRVKIDRGITGEVLDRVAASGGVELLVGLESASPRVQRLMDKYDAAETDSAAGFFASMSHSRVGLHLNLLAGFPSETVEEFRSTWTLARRVLAEAWLPTFSLNWFTLFNGSPAADRPAEFGLNQVEPIGDQLLRLRYRLSRRDRRAARAVQALLDECEADLWDAIGSRSSGDRVLDVATGLFAGSGYGLLLKANGIGASDIAAAATVSTG